MDQPLKSPGLLAPLANSGYRSLWAASNLSLIAFWMTEVAAAWQMRLMTDADPLLVASVYTALQLPIVFLVIPAGVITDLLDRRRVMVWTHLWLCASTCLLTYLVASGRVTPVALLVCLPLIAIGQALRMPGISTLIPDLVSRQHIAAAVSLNSIAQNGSRMLGPALAGAMIAALGVSAVLALNATILAVIAVLFWRLHYEAESPARRLTWQSFGPAVDEALRFAASTPWKRNVLIRLGTFFACGAAIPALMAVRFDDSVTYGLMYGCFGTGSMLGLLMIGRLGHERLDRRLSGGLLISSLCLMLLGNTDTPILAGPLLAIAGGSWIFCSNSIMVTAQLQLKRSIRGRGLSFIYAVGTISLASGGLLWGAIGRSFGPGTAVTMAGVTLLLLLLATNKLSITAPGEKLGLSDDGV